MKAGEDDTCVSSWLDYTSLRDDLTNAQAILLSDYDSVNESILDERISFCEISRQYTSLRYFSNEYECYVELFVLTDGHLNNETVTIRGRLRLNLMNTVAIVQKISVKCN